MVAARKSDDEFQKVYDILPRTDDVFNLSFRDLDLKNKLGRLDSNTAAKQKLYMNSTHRNIKPVFSFYYMLSFLHMCNQNRIRIIF